MLRLLSKLFFKLSGWKVVGEYPREIKKSVMTAAPHTSNWDFFYARAAFFLMGVPVRYTIKKEIMVFPFGPILKALGAIPIDRKRSKNLAAGKKDSMVDAMVRLFDERDELVILVTPEGTRSYAPRWKTGFYHVALNAKVPVILGYLDYKNKHAGIGPVIYPTGDVEADIEKIKK